LRNSLGGLTFGNAGDLGGGLSSGFLGDLVTALGGLSRSLGRSCLGDLGPRGSGGSLRSFLGDLAGLEDLGRSCLAGLGRSFLGDLAGLEDLGGGVSNGFGSLSGGFGNGLGGDLDALRGLSNPSGRGLSRGLLGLSNSLGGDLSMGLGGDLNGRLGRSYGRGPAAAPTAGSGSATAGGGATTQTTSAPGGKVKIDRTRLLVIADADWASNAYLGELANQTLFANSLNWLAGEEDLVAVRGLQTDLRRLALTPPRRQLMGAVTVGGVPLTALTVGIGLWYRRRRH
jgi:hypothetical protein